MVAVGVATLLMVFAAVPATAHARADVIEGASGKRCYVYTNDAAPQEYWRESNTRTGAGVASGTPVDHYTGHVGPATGLQRTSTVVGGKTYPPDARLTPEAFATVCGGDRVDPSRPLWAGVTRAACMEAFVRQWADALCWVDKHLSTTWNCSMTLPRTAEQIVNDAEEDAEEFIEDHDDEVRELKCRAIAGLNHDRTWTQDLIERNERPWYCWAWGHDSRSVCPNGNDSVLWWLEGWVICNAQPNPGPCPLGSPPAAPDPTQPPLPPYWPWPAGGP